MNLHEYQAKALFAAYGVPVPAHRVVETEMQAEQALAELGGTRWVVKAQVHAGGRGKAGGVRITNSQSDALQAVADTTGGRYFFAQDRDELESIYAELDRIGTRDVEAETYRPRIDLFWPLAAFLALLLLLHLGILLRAAWRARRVAHG